MLMKLFKKSKEKKKKPLSDKAKEERKHKIKKIVKRVLDILVYGFAIFMIFGLLLGSCNSRVKVASAYYHSDNGYTSLNSVVVGGSTTLRYYYDYNYNKTFPNFTTHLACYRNGTATSVNLGGVYIDTPYSIDNTSFTYLRCRFVGGNSSSAKYVYYLRNNGEPSVVNLDFLEVYSSSINILRSDVLTSLFSGAYSFHPISDDSYNALFYKFLVYYFGELGYNRITYNMPLNVSRLAYLFVNSDNTDNLIENGYFFKNDTFPYDNTSDLGQSTIKTLFTGSFRVNGVYYSSITITFSSVYGSVLDSHNNDYPIWYVMPGGNTIDSFNEFYKGYWYIDTITYNGNGNKTLVWRAFDIEYLSLEARWRYEFVDRWVGDSYYSSSPYRDLYIYYALSAPSSTLSHPFNDDFPQLINLSYADFLNFIGEAYPSGNAGVPSDNTSPFVSVFEWLRLALNGAMPFFGYTLLPGISIGTLVMIPITISIILFVVKLFKR